MRELAASYAPPGYGEVPGPDSALFLCAIDHRTGYRRPHEVDGEGPYAGSALLWALGLRADRRRPGLLSAAGLRGVDASDVAEIFAIEGEAVVGADVRAALWRDLAAGLDRGYGGRAGALLAACERRLGGDRGLIARLRGFAAYSDPVAKKGYLFAKIAARRGWLDVDDPGSWEVCADNVLMRLALRAGLVPPGPLDELRPATRAALKAVADAAGISPPVLDDLLWELGRDDPDLIGANAGELAEPPRDPESHWY